MLTTKFLFNDEEEAARIAEQMTKATKKTKGFGEPDGVRVFPYIKEEDNVYAAQMEVGPDTPEFNMWVNIPMETPVPVDVTVSEGESNDKNNS